MRVELCILSLTLGLLSCGSRTTPGWYRPPEGGPSPERGAYLDGQPRPWPDLPRRRDTARPLDRPRIPDKARPADASCLPIPASQVQGSYQGNWKGSWSCPGQTPQTVSGVLYLVLNPTGAYPGFSVSGSLKGGSGIVTFVSSLGGSMSCTSLNASLPDLVIYDPTGQPFAKATATLSAQYGKTPSGQWGFPSGSWALKQLDGTCTGGGTWTASK